jgi:hypothetical protein
MNNVLEKEIMHGLRKVRETYSTNAGIGEGEEK